MECGKCGNEHPEHIRFCPVCGEDVGFPNVRAAQRPEDLDALNARLDEAVRDAESRACGDAVRQFRDAMADSKAAICRHISVIQKLASSDNELYATFYQLVRSESRLPESNETDLLRGAIDHLLFPYYKKHIRFAALTLDNRGVISYGDYTIVLASDTINSRATVFEQNSLFFLQQEVESFGRTVKAVVPPPPGYRAVWDDRDRLAAAKLAHRIEHTTTKDDFPSLVLQTAVDPKDDEFIEVHIYGPIHRRGMERVAGPKPKRKDDRTILKDLKRKLREAGAELETY